MLYKNKSTRNIKVLSRIKKSKNNKNILCVIQNNRTSILRELILYITKKREKAKTIVVFTIIILTKATT